MDDCNTVIGEIVEAKQAKDEKLYFVIQKFGITWDRKSKKRKRRERKNVSRTFSRKNEFNSVLRNWQKY